MSRRIHLSRSWTTQCIKPQPWMGWKVDLKESPFGGSLETLSHPDLGCVTAMVTATGPFRGNFAPAVAGLRVRLTWPWAVGE